MNALFDHSLDLGPYSCGPQLHLLNSVLVFLSLTYQRTHSRHDRLNLIRYAFSAFNCAARNFISDEYQQYNAADFSTRSNIRAWKPSFNFQMSSYTERKQPLVRNNIRDLLWKFSRRRDFRKRSLKDIHERDRIPETGKFAFYTVFLPTDQVESRLVGYTTPRIIYRNSSDRGCDDTTRKSQPLFTPVLSKGFYQSWNVVWRPKPCDADHIKNDQRHPEGKIVFSHTHYLTHRSSFVERVAA